MKYVLIYESKACAMIPPQAATIPQHSWIRRASYDINELINTALHEQHRYAEARIEQERSGLKVWTPKLGYIGKETR